MRIVLVPVDKLGRFKAELDGEPITKPTRQPFFEAGRALLAMGHAPETELVASHVGSMTVAMRSTVGEAAKWMIEERDRGGMRKVPWKAFAGTREAPRTVAEPSEAEIPLPAMPPVLGP